MLGCMEWPHFASARPFMPPKWHDWPPREPETRHSGIGTTRRVLGLRRHTQPHLVPEMAELSTEL